MISVIIPVYNGEKYLNDLINSLIEQVHKDFEVIFIDDGSLDSSLKIIKGYMDKKVLDIKVISQPNSGPSAARNKGIDNAKGDFVCFVDSDDVLSPLYLSVLYSDFQNYKADLAVCNHSSHYDNDLINQFDDKLNHSYKVYTRTEIMKDFLYNGTNISIVKIMVKKDFINKYQVRFNEDYNRSEDTEFLWKLLNHVSCVVINKAILYHYRIRDNSLTTDFNEQNLRGIELIDNLNNYVEKHNPDFSKEFIKMAGANFRLYKLKEAVMGSNSYKQFKYYDEIIKGKQYVKNLFLFPVLKVRVMSLLYCFSPLLFYIVIKFFYPFVISKRVN